MVTRKTFLVIQLRPEAATADDELRAIMQYGGLAASEVDRIRAEQQSLDGLQLDNHCAIIVGGSPFDISTAQTLKSSTQLRVEADFRQLLTAVVAQDFPFLGCCSGNGLLGHFLGSPVTQQYGEPVGAVEVTRTDDGRLDPLLRDLPDRFEVLLGHKEACDETPPGCRLLLQGVNCPVQMFRLKNNIYATQFHPEADFRGFTIRIEAYRHHGYFPAEEADALRDSLEGIQTPHAQAILARFVRRYRPG